MSEKEKFYSCAINHKNNLVVKIMNEKYSKYVVEIANVHMDDDKNVLFDVLDFPEELNEDNEYIGLLQAAVGDVVTQAVTALHADQAAAEHQIQDVYFTKILREFNVHCKTTLTTTQIMKALKLYPVPILDDENLLPDEDADLEEYLMNTQGYCDYTVVDLDDNRKEYNMTIPEEKEAFVKLLKERGTEYLF